MFFFCKFHKMVFSSYPIFFGLSFLSFMGGMLMFMKFGFFYTLIFAIFYMTFISYLWLKDVMLEDMSGQYSFYDYRVFCQGFRLFILSEFILFLTVFWCYFDYTMAPIFWLGGSYLPKGIISVSYLGLNALATSFLMMNSQLVKYSRRMICNNDDGCLTVVLICIFIGLGFISFQLYEYSNLYYCICDSTFGSVFFLGTGLHGSHVFVGVWFLIFCYFRLVLLQFNWVHLQMMDMSIDYWRFLEWMWGVMFSLLYIWGS
uniref:Cytochrome c oxidase subunit 3 n=1 Tax=Crassicauda sp. Ningbo-2019 TaxID=2860933 RepID=A0A8F6U4G0_9BILA|nr:cytochrome c oxidase subunit 3 [Crassicauda sp. Ningbo-2019]WHL46735.1 cytochrome c oxidase subunit 3 [Crassicauda magna]